MMAKLQAGEHHPVRVVGRRGARSGRLGGLRRGAVAGGARPHRAVHQLRHDRLAELHLHGVRRGRVDVRGAGGRSRRAPTAIEDLYESYYTLIGEPYDDTEFSGRSDYEAFIAGRHPVRRPVHRRRRDQDRAAGSDLGRRRRGAVRPLLPRGVRHLRQRRSARARGQQRPHRLRAAGLRVLDRDRSTASRASRCPAGASTCRLRQARRARSPGRAAAVTGLAPQAHKHELGSSTGGGPRDRPR